MSAATFRRIALSLDSVLASAHGGHPGFRAGGKVFASLTLRSALGMAWKNITEKKKKK